MTLGSASLTLLDGGLGIGAQLDRPVAVIGCASGGTAGSVVELSTPQDVATTWTSGPLVQSLAHILKHAGGPVIGVRATSAAAGVLGGVAQEGGGSSSAGTVTADGSNTSTAIPALTGTPDVPYAVRIKVTTAGSNIAANPKVQVSMDGGATWLLDDSVDVSATPQAIGSTGLLLGWTAGTFVANDFWLAVGANCPTSADATGSTVVTASGTPVDSFDIRAKIVRAASTPAAGAAIKVSIDGGRTYGEEVSIVSGSYEVPNTGVTLAFSAASCVVGDIYRLRTAAPTWDATGLDAALDALATSGRDFEFVVVEGAVNRTTAATVKTWRDEREAAGQYTFALCEARGQATGETVAAWQTSITGATPGFQGYDFGKAGVIFAGEALVVSAVDGSAQRRSGLRVLASRLLTSKLHESPLKVKNGPVVALFPDGDSSSVFHDGRVYTSLDLARFACFQTVQGRARGEYFLTARTMAPASSDYGEVQRLRVMCAAARAGLPAIALYVGDDVETKTDGTGRITEADAQAIEAEVVAAVKLAVKTAPNEHVTTVSALCNRTDNILTAGILRVAITIVPRGTTNTVTATIGYRLAA
jgi:hypothetical protein